MPALNTQRILLIHPLGYQAAAAGRDVSRRANLMPPIGLASLAAWLARHGMDAAILDCFAQPNSEQLLREQLLRERPAFLGVSCTTSSFLDGVRLTRLAKATLPGIRAVFGGPHVSALREQVLARFPEVDFVVVGEGEQTLVELLAREGREVGAIPGLVYRDAGGQAVFTGFRDAGLDLDQLPFPAYEKLAGFPRAYQLPIFNYPRAPNVSCVTSRGCPYACSYCDRSVFRRGFRHNSADYMYAHIQYLRERFRIRHVNFYDDQFTFNRDRVMAFTRRLIDRPLGLTFNCAARAEHLDADLLRQMKAAGCWMISLGIETGDADLLAQHRTNADLEMLAEKIRLIKRFGIRVKGLLMMGLPGETEASVRKSMAYVFALPIDDLNVAKFTPFPGAPLYARIRELGAFEEEWEKMDCLHFQFVPTGLTRARLEELFREFYKSHFMRPRVLWDYTTMFWRSPDSWRRFFLSLPTFIRYARSNRRLGK